MQEDNIKDLERSLTDAKAEIKDLRTAKNEAQKEQQRLLAIVRGLCAMEPNPSSSKQLFIQNKALKLQLSDADFRVRAMYLNYESLEKRHNDLLFSRYEEFDAKRLQIQVNWLQQKLYQTKAALYKKLPSTNDEVESLKTACRETRIALLDSFGLFGGGEKLNKVFDILNRALKD